LRPGTKVRMGPAAIEVYYRTWAINWRSTSRLSMCNASTQAARPFLGERFALDRKNPALGIRTGVEVFNDA